MLRLMGLLSLLLCPFLLMPPAQAQPAPPIIGRTLTGEMFKYPTQKTVVVNFFWVECKPCVEELPELAQLADEFPAVEVVAVHVEEADTQTIQAFIDRLKRAPKTVVRGSSKIKESYQIKSLPTTVVIDPAGQIRLKIQGFTSEGMSQLKNQLQSLRKTP